MGGCKAFKYNLQEVCVWNMTCQDGKLSLFGDIEDNMWVRIASNCVIDGFLAGNARPTTFDKRCNWPEPGSTCICAYCREFASTGE